MAAGNLFSLIFGRKLNLDAHDSPPIHDALKSPLAHVYSAPRYLEGIHCYVDSIYLTMLATFLAILLSVWAGYRDRLKIASCNTKIAGRSEVVWQDKEGGE